MPPKARQRQQQPHLPVVSEETVEAVSEEFRNNPDLYASTWNRLNTLQPDLIAYMGSFIDKMGHSADQKAKRMQVLVFTYRLLEREITQEGQ